MIRNDEELRHSLRVLTELHEALVTLRHDLGGARARAFEVLAEGPLHDLRRITAEIEDYTGAAAAESAGVELWMRLDGKKARWRDTAASVLATFLESIRKGVQAVAGYNVHKQLSGRPVVEIQKACDFGVVVFQPGSLRIGLTFPDDEQQDLFVETPTGKVQVAEQARIALGDYVSAIAWAASAEPRSALETTFPDPEKRRVVLRAAKALVPKPAGGVDFVELSGRLVPGGEPLHITAQAGARITGAIEAETLPDEQYIGQIREMDLDRRSFKLRNVEDTGEVACKLVDDLGPLEEVYLGKRVRVLGSRTRPGAVLDVVDIERIDDLTPAE